MTDIERMKHVLDQEIEFHQENKDIAVENGETEDWADGFVDGLIFSRQNLELLEEGPHDISPNQFVE